MKRSISVLLIISGLFTWTGIYLPESKAAEELKEEGIAGQELEKKLKEIYAEILCVGCGGEKTIDHSDDCPVAQDLRAQVRSLVAKGFDKETIVWNFNGNNIAFIYQLPAEVIRKLDCPCACAEKVWVCLGSENRYDCPVIETVVEDIRNLKEQGKSDAKIIKLLKSDEYQEKYRSIIEPAIDAFRETQNYDISGIPDFILDNVICSCEGTETLRTCIEKMPWCKRIESMIMMAKIYLYVMKLEPEDVVLAMYAPCGKMCGKKTGGEYLGENCSVCQRPILDKGYYFEVNGEEEVFCCISCYELGQPLPQAILDNVECRVCPCKKTIGECSEEHYCPLLPAQKKLIKVWLLQGISEEEVIRKLR